MVFQPSYTWHLAQVFVGFGSHQRWCHLGIARCFGLFLRIEERSLPSVMTWSMMTSAEALGQIKNIIYSQQFVTFSDRFFF